MSENVIFMIESGRALELIKEHIAERKRVAVQAHELAKELGVEYVSTSSLTGVLHAVYFRDSVHPDFTKPDSKGASRPKKKTEWAKRFADQKGYEPPSEVIAKAFGIPLAISHAVNGDGVGVRCIGFPLQECGFLWLAEDGPYAMWVPDVPAEVAEDEAKAHTVDEPAKSFKLEFDGCRRIERDEWELLVIKDRLAKKRASTARAA